MLARRKNTQSAAQTANFRTPQLHRRTRSIRGRADGELGAIANGRGMPIRKKYTQTIFFTVRSEPSLLSMCTARSSNIYLDSEQLLLLPVEHREDRRTLRAIKVNIACVKRLYRQLLGTSSQALPLTALRK